MVSVKWSSQALLDLEKIDPTIRERILGKVTWFGENFTDIVPEKLHRELARFYKLRVGDYRVIYSYSQNGVIIETVGHRRDVYTQ